MHCHPAHTGRQLLTVLAHTSLLTVFIRKSSGVPRSLVRLVSAGTMVTILSHILVGAACSFSSVSAAIHLLWPTLPMFRIHLLQLFLFTQIMIRPVALHFVRTTNRHSQLKHTFLNVLALANLLLMFILWNRWHDTGERASVRTGLCARVGGQAEVQAS